MYTSYVFIALALIAVILVFRTATVVPQQSAYVVENLGKYSRTLQAGFHILIPFVERVAYRHNLKEQALDVPEQICITKDNVQVGVDAVLYMQVLDPHLRSRARRGGSRRYRPTLCFRHPRPLPPGRSLES